VLSAAGSSFSPGRVATLHPAPVRSLSGSWGPVVSRRQQLARDTLRSLGATGDTSYASVHGPPGSGYSSPSRGGGGGGDGGYLFSGGGGGPPSSATKAGRDHVYAAVAPAAAAGLPHGPGVTGEVAAPPPPSLTHAVWTAACAHEPALCGTHALEEAGVATAYTIGPADGVLASPTAHGAPVLEPEVVVGVMRRCAPVVTAAVFERLARTRPALLPLHPAGAGPATSQGGAGAALITVQRLRYVCAQAVRLSA